MRKIILNSIYWGLITTVFILGFNSCEEIPPDINMSEGAINETTYVETVIPSAQDKIVLLEDLSGVQCVNCPNGHEKGEEISLNNPNKVIIMVLHSNSSPFTTPHDTSKYDFRTTEATTIETMVGSPQGYPAGYVDRVLFSGETDRILSTTQWESFVTERLIETTPVNIVLDKSFDETTKKVKAIVELHYTASVTDTHFVSVVLIENKIIDYQLTPIGSDYNYEHNHVLRAMFTSATGDQISTTQTGVCETFDKGCVFIKTYEIDLPTDANADNCEIVGIVHLKSGTKLDVVHVAKISVK